MYAMLYLPVTSLTRRCGDLRRGVNIATELNSKQLKRECADILENKKVRLGWDALS